MKNINDLYLDCFKDVQFEHNPNFTFFSGKLNDIIIFVIQQFLGFIKYSKIESNNFICVICLNKVTNKVSLDCCKHEFCFMCIKKWRKIKSTCPVCRKFIKAIKKSTQ